MIVSELKALLPADTAVVYINGVELLPEDVETDEDGDFNIYPPDEDAADDESDEGEEEEEDEAE